MIDAVAVASGRDEKLRELVAPLPIAAVALLAANDHYLKARFHNAITGKLSDLAICFLLPLFLSASLGAVTSLAARARLVAGALVTAAVFTALKVSPAADHAYCRALDAAWSWAGLRFTAVADWTDLFCLPMVVVSALYGWRRSAKENP